MTFVSFGISKEGKVTQVKLVKGSHELLDEESIRVTNEMPDWTPGEVEGKAVAVEMKLPFNYKLPKEDVKD